MKLSCYALCPDPPPLVPARAERRWMEQFPTRHPYRCLPLSIANAHGWEILSPCSFTVHWSGGPGTEDITFITDVSSPYLKRFVASNFSQGIVTFHTGYLFRTEPGWNLLATGPFNEPKDGIAPLTGIVESNWLPYPFTMNWQLTRPGSVSWQKNEPFCTIFPILNGILQTVQPEILSLESDQRFYAEYLAWRKMREDFIKFRAKGELSLEDSWQRYYFKGEYPDDPSRSVEGHIQKLRLASPVDKRRTTS
jgi:hypothetical protein